ncbi:MAG TPA: 1-acyl-sn-glycerol-3-phosphate acyltransferase [Alphaproteobacteria bacterium]|nr:1-acyl-sn-glycerol-3-phosphate acyltransferase [Alphaproteobacteria bacterium]
MLYIRSIVFNIYLYLLTVLLAGLGLPVLLLPRRAVAGVLRLWARLVNLGLRVICNIRVEIRGRDRLPDGASLIAAKHQSMWDTIVFFDLLPDIVYVLKKELAYIPLYGWFAVRAGMIRVDRDAHAKALRHLVKQAKTKASDGRPILIFPEGTRVAPGEHIGYKPGIAALYSQLDIPCVPVAVNSGLFWPRRQFLRRPGTIILEILPPIPPGLKRRDFMRRLETELEEASNALVLEAGGTVAASGAPYAPAARELVHDTAPPDPQPASATRK